MELDTARVTADGGVGEIILDQPGKQNAITGPAVADLERAFDWLTEQEVRAVVLSSSGPVFCAGADLRELAAAREQLDERAPGVEVRGWMDMMAALSALILRVRRYPYPVIAAVDGAAYGGGANLALACDMRIASERATFASSFIRVGLSSAAMGGTYLWPHTIGLGRALEAMLTGRVIDAEEADRIGLVNRVVAAERVHEETMELARRLAELPPLGLRATKRGVNVGATATLEQALEFEASLQSPLFMTDDHYEGMRAFMDKRPSAFEGR